MHALIPAPTLDMARPGDLIGLGRGLTPARRTEDVHTWRPVIASFPVGPNRHRVIVRGNAGEIPMTTAPGVPVVLKRA